MVCSNVSSFRQPFCGSKILQCLQYFPSLRCMKRHPKKLELPSGGLASCSTGFPCQVSVLGTHLYQCASWHHERMVLASVNFFWRFLQRVCPFHDGWFVSTTPVHTVLRAQQFLTQNGMTPVPHPAYSPNLTTSDFSVSPDEKSLKEARFASVEVKQKTAEAHKRHQNRLSSKTVLNSEKKSQKLYCIKWRVFWRWMKFKHVRIHNF